MAKKVNLEEQKNTEEEKKEGWAVTQEEDGNVHVRPTENGEIIDTPVEKIIKADGTEVNVGDEPTVNNFLTDEKSKEEKKEEKPKKDSSKKKVEVPKCFIKQKRGLNTFQYGNYNGRKYKVLKNGCGMWADTGKVFKLSDLD